jgi:fucose permease
MKRYLIAGIGAAIATVVFTLINDEVSNTTLYAMLAWILLYQLLNSRGPTQ